MELSFEPGCDDWKERIAGIGAGRLGDASVAELRRRTRRELGLTVDRPIVATGHQSLLWHPGILVKYLVVQAITGECTECAAANLVVDQHTGDFGSFDMPARSGDGALVVRSVTLTEVSEGVPMGWHPAFVPAEAGVGSAALPCVETGVRRIVGAVAAHADRPNAALQMAAALAELMSPWVRPWPDVSSSDLMKTSLAGAILKEMIRDSRACAAAYNAAVAAVPEAGIGALAVSGDRVELPLWRRGAADRREHADDGDVRRWLAGGDEKPELLPRALLLTLLVRLGMCDLFVHGTGGARYDRAMERWLDDWLGLRPAPIATATASLRLPLGRPGERPVELADAQRAARRAWHDPESGAGRSVPGPRKTDLLEAVNAAARRSLERRRAFTRMHEALTDLRRDHADRVDAARRREEIARRQALEAPIAARRDWAFPLYPPEMIDELAAAVRDRVRMTIQSS